MVKHIKAFNIDSFRGVKDLELKDLGDVNILVGSNNSGKTSVLESIMLLSSPDQFANIVSIARLREANKMFVRGSISFFDSFLYLFNQLDEELILRASGFFDNVNTSITVKGSIEKLLIDEAEKNISTKGKVDVQQRLFEASRSEEVDTFIGELHYSGLYNKLPPENTIHINFNRYDRQMRIDKKNAFINIVFLSSIEHITKNIFNETIRNKMHKKDVIKILKLFDANIKDLRIVQDDFGRIVQVVENVLLQDMPLSTYGDGIKKVIALANAIAEAKNGILLVDEIETSIHQSVLKDVFSWLINSCKKFNVQLFFTTHSLETVDAMLTCKPEAIENDLIRVITLVKKENKTVARILSGEKALQVRDDYDMELRK